MKLYINIFIGIILCTNFNSFSAQTSNTAISFKNISGLDLGMYYFDEYNDFTKINLPNNKLVSIQSNSFVVIYSTSFKKQVFLAYPKDTINVLLNKNGLYALTLKSTKDNERLNIFEEIENKINPFSNKSDYLVRKSKIMSLYNSPLERDSILNKQYEKELEYFNFYTNKYVFSNQLITFSQQYYYFKFIRERASILNTKAFKEKKMPESFSVELLNLRTLLNNDSAIYIDTYKQFAEDYLTYLMSVWEEKTMLNVIDNFKGSTKDFLLLSLLKIYASNNKNLFDENYDLFLSECKNNNYKNYIEELHKVNTLKENKSNNEFLSASTAISTSFSDILQKYKGKVIYIDFWASWCSPCIDEFQYSFSLQREYKNKNVVFLFFSLDKNKNLWTSAIKANKLDPLNSYLVLNDFNSDIANKLKIKEIPRYILINKVGDIVEVDAARPSESKLVEKINKLL